MKRVIGYILATVVLFSLSHGAYARKKKPKGTKAKVVLVQLSTEHNRIDALLKEKKYAAAKEVATDAENVITVIMKDFSDNFSYCPVYYYLDTNINKIKNREFDGILLDSSLAPLTNAPLTKNSKDYMVIYYGRPVAQSRHSRVQRDTTKYIFDSDTPFGRGLVVLNYKFQQLRYFNTLNHSDPFFGPKKSQYYYSSKHYNIEYSPLVPYLNKKVPLIYE